MKRIIVIIMFFSVVFCACAKEENNETVSDSAVMESDVPGDVAEEANEDEKVNEANGLNPDTAMTIIMAKKDEPMLSDKVDLSQKGIEMGFAGFTGFATRPIKGDDGNCYYFRYQGKKGCKVIFYKNNAIKVCETVLPKKYEKDWYILTFLKHGEQFWVLFASDEYSKEILVPVQINDGKWGKGIKTDLYERFIYYKDCFYSFGENDVTVDIIDMKGNKKSLKFEKEEKSATLQAIIDDKLYYIIEEYITEESDDDTAYYIVMRCDMDGSNKEELFRYSNVYSTMQNECRLTMDEDFLYLFDPDCGFTLTRIPLYGGEVEKILATDRYELTEDSIYYLDEMGKICRVDKDLTGRPEVVTLRDEYPTEEPLFLCADRHLLVEGYNEEESNIINEIFDMDDYGIMCDIGMNYSDEYYWVAENGEVEDIISGSGLKKKYYEWYEMALKYNEHDY